MLMYSRPQYQIIIVIAPNIIISGIVTAFKLSCDKHTTYHIWSAAWQGSGAQRLEALSEQYMPEQYSTGCLKERGVEEDSG